MLSVSCKLGVREFQWVSVCEGIWVRKGAWTAEEDRKLVAYITRYGHWNWRELPKYAGLSRCGKSCRLRWLKYLRPGSKSWNFSRKEDEIIIKLHQALGNKWAAIAGILPGRTENEIKNYWHISLKKGLGQNMTPSEAPKTTESVGCAQSVKGATAALERICGSECKDYCKQNMTLSESIDSS